MAILRNVELATGNNEGESEIRAIARNPVGNLRRTASKCVENKGIVDREIWTLINEKKRKNSPFGIRLEKQSEELKKKNAHNTTHKSTTSISKKRKSHSAEHNHFSNAKAKTTDRCLNRSERQQRYKTRKKKNRYTT